MKQKSFKKIKWSTKEQPALNPISKDLYETVVENKYEWVADNRKYEITIPEGFVCDGNSSPRIGRGIIRPDGINRLAGLVHDALYRSGGGQKNSHLKVRVYYLYHKAVDYNEGRWFFADLSRKQCDQMYRAIGLFTAQTRRDRMAINFSYRMLRVFGKKHFGSKKPPYAK